MSALVVTRSDLGQAVELVRSSVVYIDRKGVRVKSPSPKGKTLRGAWADSILQKFVKTFDWALEKAQAVLAALKKRSNPRLRDTQDGRIISVCPPSQRHRAQAIRAGRSSLMLTTPTSKGRGEDRYVDRYEGLVDRLVEAERRRQWADFFVMTAGEHAEQRAIAAMEDEQQALVSFLEHAVGTNTRVPSDDRQTVVRSDRGGAWPPLVSDADVEELVEAGCLILDRP